MCQNWTVVHGPNQKYRTQSLQRHHALFVAFRARELFHHGTVLVSRCGDDVALPEGLPGRLESTHTCPTISGLAAFMRLALAMPEEEPLDKTNWSRP